MGDHPPLPRDKFEQVCADGSNAVVFLNEHNGGATSDTWQPVTLPPNLTCNIVVVQVNSGNMSDYTSVLNPPVFKFASSNTGIAALDCVGTIKVRVGKLSGETIGYVKAQLGNKIVVGVVA